MENPERSYAYFDPVNSGRDSRRRDEARDKLVVLQQQALRYANDISRRHDVKMDLDTCLEHVHKDEMSKLRRELKRDRETYHGIAVTPGNIRTAEDRLIHPLVDVVIRKNFSGDAYFDFIYHGVPLFPEF